MSSTTITLIPARCPICKKILYLNSSVKDGYCMYCGSELSVEHAIRLYDPKLDPAIQTEEAEKKQNLLLRSEQLLQLNQKDFSQAAACYEKVLDEYDPRCAIAWWNLFKLKICCNFDPNLFLPLHIMDITEHRFLEELRALEQHSYYQYAFEYATPDEGENFFKEYSLFLSQCEDFYRRSLIRQIQKENLDCLSGIWQREAQNGITYIEFFSNPYCGYMILGDKKEDEFFYSKFYYHQPIDPKQFPYFELIKSLSENGIPSKLSIHPLSTKNRLVLDNMVYKRFTETFRPSLRLKFLRLWIQFLLFLQ